jgi:RND family efflux transporter MFP subunit
MAGTVMPPASGSIPRAGTRVQRGESLLRLIPLPSDHDLLGAEARLRQAEAEAARVARLYADRLVSAREQEQTQADLAAARATNEAARSQAGAGLDSGAIGRGTVSLAIVAPQAGIIRSLSAAPGQTVAAGAPLTEIIALDLLWVRVPVYAGSVREVASGRAAAVHRLRADDGARGWAARPVRAPPSADPAAASVDLFYEVVGAPDALQPGERVEVTLPLQAAGGRALTVPLAAVVYDMNGSAWVYRQVDSVTFTRQRIEISRVVGGVAVLARGPGPGTPVVTAGVVELFGTEFGVGK